jgi:hypothetical protein
MQMDAFSDPRSYPNVSVTESAARITNDPEGLKELHCLCRDGRLYDVERWIQAGRPLRAGEGTVVRQRRVSSALEIALDARNQALVLLLLCNGYDLNHERESPLDLTLRARRWDLLDLLLGWGADPKRASLSDLFDTYNSELFERFRNFKVDLTAGHEMAATLAYHTSNKPLFGFAKRHRTHDPKVQTELNIALVHHVSEQNEKGVQLCLWAGADAHAPAHSLRFPDSSYDEDNEGDESDRFMGFSAIEESCRSGDIQILERLGPDPSRDNFDELYREAANSSIVELLARSALPKDMGAVLRSQIYWLAPFFGRPRSTYTLQSLFEAGARWETSTTSEIGDIRRALLKTSDLTFVDAMKLLAKDDYCSPTILRDLAKTPTIRARMKRVGFIPSPPDPKRDLYQSRPTRSKEVLAKCGIELPKPKPRLPHTIQIGGWRKDGHEVRLDRAALFDRVWSEPVEKLAKDWGLSGRGLAKVCRRLQIPVPPRGFWAKLQHGQRMRRPRLGELPPGEAEVIVIRMPE